MLSKLVPGPLRTFTPASPASTIAEGAAVGGTAVGSTDATVGRDVAVGSGVEVGKTALVGGISRAVVTVGNGWVGSPGIYTDKMVEGWRIVTQKLKPTGTPNSIH